MAELLTGSFFYAFPQRIRKEDKHDTRRDGGRTVQILDQPGAT